MRFLRFTQLALDFNIGRFGQRRRPIRRTIIVPMGDTLSNFIFDGMFLCMAKLKAPK